MGNIFFSRQPTDYKAYGPSLLEGSGALVDMLQMNGYHILDAEALESPKYQKYDGPMSDVMNSEGKICKNENDEYFISIKNYGLYMLDMVADQLVDYNMGHSLHACCVKARFVEAA